MGKYLSKCCQEEEKIEEPKEFPSISNLKPKEKEVVVENLDKSDISMIRNPFEIKPASFPEKPLKEMQNLEKNKLLANTEKEEKEEKDLAIESKETGFQDKSNNFQEIFKSPGKNTKENTQNIIQELREIQKSQLALIKSKQHVLPNQIDESVENFDKNKKVTDIFNMGSGRKENEEPERPPKIEEKSEELEND